MSRFSIVVALFGLLALVGLTGCGTGETDRTPSNAGTPGFVLSNVALEMQQQQVKFPSLGDEDVTDSDTGDASADGTMKEGSDQTCTNEECIANDDGKPWCYAQDGYCTECLNDTHCGTGFDCNSVFVCELKLN